MGIDREFQKKAEAQGSQEGKALRMSEEATQRYALEGASEPVPPPDASPRAEGIGFLWEVWVDLRPYLGKLIVDFCISAGLWIALYLFELLTKLLAIGGWAGEYIVNIHATGVVLAFAAFGVLFCLDVWAIRTSKGRIRKK